MISRLCLLILLVNPKIASMEQLRLQKNTIYVENVDIPNGFGRTSLMRAALIGDIHKIETLLAHGANVNLQDTNGRTALLLALTYPQEGIICHVVLRLLAYKSIDLLITDKENLTALQIIKQQSMSLLSEGNIYRKHMCCEIGRMLLTHLRLYSAHGRVCKHGLRGILPIDILKLIATYIDYKEAAEEFKQ